MYCTTCTNMNLDGSWSKSRIRSSQAGKLMSFVVESVDADKGQKRDASPVHKEFQHLPFGSPPETNVAISLQSHLYPVCSWRVGCSLETIQCKQQYQYKHHGQPFAPESPSEFRILSSMKANTIRPTSQPEFELRMRYRIDSTRLYSSKVFDAGHVSPAPCPFRPS